MVECPICGLENPPDAGSCAQCGFALSLAGSAWPDLPAPPPRAAKESEASPPAALTPDVTAPSPPGLDAPPRPDGGLMGEAEPDELVPEVSESPAGGAYPAVTESPSAPVDRPAIRRDTARDAERYAPRLTGDMLVAIVHDMRDALVEGARSLGTLVMTIPDLWREKLELGFRLALAMGATGGALMPILASLARLSDALESGGVAPFMEAVVATGGCVLLSTALGSVLGLVGGLLVRNSGATDRLIPSAERRRTAYTVMGGAFGAGLALVMGVILSRWLIQPG